MLVLKEMKHQMSDDQIVSLWSEGTDAEIVNILKMHYNGDIDLKQYWSVGDERVVNLSAMSATEVSESHVAQPVVFVLSNVGGKMLADGETECLFQVDQKGVLCDGTTIEYGYMNSTDTNGGGWRDSARRTWCNSVYYNAIPKSLRSIFKQYKNKIRLGNVEETTDYFALRSEKEVFNNMPYSLDAGDSYIEYYETTSNRIKSTQVVDGSWYDANWWLRSMAKDTSGAFCAVSTSGSASPRNASATTLGIAPFGVI